MDFIIFKSVCLLGCLLKNGFKTTREAVLPSARGCRAEELAFPCGGGGCWGCLVYLDLPSHAVLGGLWRLLWGWPQSWGGLPGRRAGPHGSGRGKNSSIHLVPADTGVPSCTGNPAAPQSPLSAGAPISPVEHPQTAGCRQVFVDATKWPCPRTQHLSAAVG